MMLAAKCSNLETPTMPSNQTESLTAEPDECRPFMAAPPTLQLSKNSTRTLADDNEEYLQRLSAALDKALNL
jgi:hypothetical protein